MAAELELRWQKAWEQAKIFESNRDETKKKFFIIFAYPYTSGFLHVGHMRGFTYADIIARYMRMRGYNVLFPVGTHATGNAAFSMAKKIKAHDRNTLETLKAQGCTDEILQRLTDPHEIVKFFTASYIQDWKRFGLSIDTRRVLCSISPDYSKFIEWQFRKLRERGLLTQKPYYGTACINCGPVAVDPSETDIAKGGTAEKLEYTILKFGLKSADGTQEFIVAATLRPETVFGQTNIWVNDEVEYVRVRVGDEVWIMSSECAEKLAYQRDNVVVVGRLAGSTLIGKFCRAPVIERDIIILPSSFADPKIGTGIVTSVPSDAPYDYQALLDLKKDSARIARYGLSAELIDAIKPIPIIDSKDWGDLPAVKICTEMGIEHQRDPKLETATKLVYKVGYHTGVMKKNCAPYDGLPVEEAKRRIREDMIARGQADIFFDLSEEVICRCSGKVVIKKIPDQWFIRYSDEELTARTTAHVANMKIFPEEYKSNLPAVLNWFQDRACARIGNWLGTKLPFDQRWIIEAIADSTLYPLYYLISLYINSGKLTAENLTESFFDYVFLSKGESAEVSEQSGIEQKLLEEIKQDVDYFYPLDINLGGKEHQTVHFPVFLMNHVGILPEKKWPRELFVHWWVEGKAGEKLSKSKGGTRAVGMALEEFSVDGLRLYYAHAASPFADVEWDENAVISYRDRIEKLRGFIEQLLTISKHEENPKLDSWLRSRVQRRIGATTESIEKRDLRTASNIVFFDLHSDIRWYLKRGGSDKKTLEDTISVWIRMLCPFTPYFAEELWEKFGTVRAVNKFVSVADWPEFEPEKIDELSEAAESYLQMVLTDINEILRVTGLKPNRIMLFTAPKWKFEVLRLIEMQQKIGKFEMSEVMSHLATKPELKTHMKEAAELVRKCIENLNRGMTFPKFDELAVLKSAQAFLNSEFGCRIEISSADDPCPLQAEKKRAAAIPMKPGIFVE